MAGGYVGRYLKINLTSGEIKSVPLNEKDTALFLGGSGLATRWIAEDVAAGPDPLGPENPLVIVTGPAAGTPTPTSNRFAAAARSPLTRLWGEGDCGGRWASALKGAGFDGLWFTGQSRQPVYLHIENGEAELRDGRALWGVDTYDLDLGGPAICIGPAAERGVLFGAIMHDGSAGRAVGRTGLGTVMASKRLKAVVAIGKERTHPARPEVLREAIRAVIGPVVEATKGIHLHGTAGGIENYERLGNLPIKNWKQGSWRDGAIKTTGMTMTDTILTGRYACQGCPIGCGREVEIKSGPHAGVRGSGPEYETATALGALCLIDDLEAICQMNEYCNRQGMDTITAGGVLAFAMEAREVGIWPEGPCWGNAEEALDLLRRIAERDGDVPTLLGLGTRRAAEVWGGLAREFAIHVKGLEFPMHEPRAYVSLAIGFATCTRGADHLQAYSHPYERLLKAPALGIPETMPREAAAGKGAAVARLQNWMALFDSLKVCKFLVMGGFQPEHLVSWANAVTGRDLSLEDWLKTGERICNLRRVINARLGASRADDTLPPRILFHRRGEGGAPDSLPPFGPMLADYYAERRWNEMGLPTPELLKGLDLEEYADWV